MTIKAGRKLSWPNFANIAHGNRNVFPSIRNIFAWNVPAAGVQVYTRLAIKRTDTNKVKPLRKIQKCLELSCVIAYCPCRKCNIIFALSYSIYFVEKLR